jgi:hypothetical protein
MAISLDATRPATKQTSREAIVADQTFVIRESNVSAEEWWVSFDPELQLLRQINFYFPATI